MQSILRSHPTKPLARLLGCMLAGALCMLAFTLSPEGYVGISDPPLRAGSAEWLLPWTWFTAARWDRIGRAI